MMQKPLPLSSALLAMTLLGSAHSESPDAETADMAGILENGLKDAVTETGLIGVSGGLTVNGELVTLAAAGHRTKAAETAVTTKDLWHLGSITKSFTALLIASMVEKGEISFDDTVEKLLPDLAEAIDPGWRKVTVHQLLTHTSGAPANFGMFVTWIEDPAQGTEARRKALTSIMANPPKSPSGSQFAYSNLGYTLAGHMAEVRLDIPYHQALRQRIFETLGLTTAGFGPPPGEQPIGHASLLGFKKTASRSGRGSDNTFIIAPAGLVHMSIQDLLRYGQEHLKGARGEDGLIRASTMKFLHQPVLDNYASGLVVMERESAGGKIIWHNGSNTMWYALLIIAPSKNAVVALATNDGSIRKAEKAFFGLADELLKSIP